LLLCGEARNWSVKEVIGNSLVPVADSYAVAVALYKEYHCGADCCSNSRSIASNVDTVLTTTCKAMCCTHVPIVAAVAIKRDAIAVDTCNALHIRVHCRALQLEVGSDVPLEKTVGTGTSWKGRAQQIALLKAKLKAAQQQLAAGSAADYDCSVADDLTTASYFDNTTAGERTAL
jgi:hypothetical protein